MADNFGVSGGTVGTVATDDISSVHYQRVKLVDGTLDSTVAIGAAGGAEANALRVTMANDSTGLVATKGRGFSSTGTLTLGTAAYTVGDVAGGLITFLNAVSGTTVKHSIINTITLAAATSLPYELWFFNADIGTPAADNAVFNLAAADATKFLGARGISAGDYMGAVNAFYNATLAGVGLQVGAASGTAAINGYLKALGTAASGTTTYYVTINGEYID